MLLIYVCEQVCLQATMKTPENESRAERTRATRNWEALCCE